MGAGRRRPKKLDGASRGRTKEDALPSRSRGVLWKRNQGPAQPGNRLQFPVWQPKGEAIVVDRTSC